MKRLLVLSSLCAVFLFAASSARADSVTLTGTGDSRFSGYSAGPYSATLNGASITMMCLSFDRRVSVGQTWQVAVNTLDAAGIANALYGTQANALLSYQRAAWLYDQLGANSGQAGAIQGAVWNIFNSGSTPDTADSNRWLMLSMNQNFANYDFSRFRILTPLNRGANGPQENITAAPVPEPATMLLLGTGLAGIAAKVSRRRKARTNGEEDQDDAITSV